MSAKKFKENKEEAKEGWNPNKDHLFSDFSDTSIEDEKDSKYDFGR